MSSSRSSRWASFLRTPVRQLSLGQRMRGDFAAALLHSPRDRLSRRADDRTRRRREGSDTGVHRAHQRRTRRDDRSHHARSGRRRAALPADRLDRSRHAHLRRRHRSHQERVRKVSHADRAFQRTDREAAARRGAACRRRGFERTLSASTAICNAPICSFGKRVNVIASKTSAWKSRISSRSSGESTSRDTAAGRRRTHRDSFRAGRRNRRSTRAPTSRRPRRSAAT